MTATTTDVSSSPSSFSGVGSAAASSSKSRDERRKTLIRQTWRSIESLQEEKFTLAFYERLFQKFPQFLSLFENSSPQSQAMKLYEVISVAVRFLDDLPQIVPVLQDLGRRHVVYGVRRHHYAVVNEVFVEVLYDFLYAWWPADDQSSASMSLFLLDVTDAWCWVLTTIGNIMADAADDAAAAATSSSDTAASSGPSSVSSSTNTPTVIIATDASTEVDAVMAEPEGPTGSGTM